MSAWLTQPRVSTLPGTLLEHAAGARADSAFVEVWDEKAGVQLSVTYKQLRDCMMSAAVWLRSGANLQHGDYCAMLAHNSLGYLSISLGAMALGATSLNLNWRQPPSVTQTLLSDLTCKVLVASRPFKATAQEMHTKVGIRMFLIESICAAAPSLPFPPPSVEDAADIGQSIAALSPSTTCAVFFTGGTTGTPKAVPHTHAGLLWFAARSLDLFPEPFADNVEHSGTVCFTPFFHVMGFCANFVFNLHARCRAFILHRHETKLSPALMLQAVKELRPSCVNTIPYVVEGLVELVRSGESGAAAALSSLHLLTYGGAALPPHCAPILKDHGISVACTYGQTELAGPVMFGKQGGDPNALRPLPGVKFELVRGPEDDEDEGELILLGNGSATPGYLKLASETRAYRSLSGDSPSTSTTKRFHTGDRFRRATVDGEKGWLFYQCRADDLLVHTSGEMTNPLPTEQMMLAACAGVVDAACCVGNNLARPFLLLELVAGVDGNDESVKASLVAGVAAANKTQPAYSHVLTRHVAIMPPGSLPRTVKGTVQRNSAAKLYAADLDAIRLGEPPKTPGAQMLVCVDDDESDDDDGADSLAVTKKSKKRGKVGQQSAGPLEHLVGLRTVGALWIVMAHMTMRDRKVHSIDSIRNHAHLAASFFLIISGFNLQWAHGATAAPIDATDASAESELLPGPKAKLPGPMTSRSCSPYLPLRVIAHLLRWYAERFQRIIVATWVAMISCLIMYHAWFTESWQSKYPPGDVAECLAFVRLYDTSYPANATGDHGFSWQHCPNAPLWFIALLVPCWLLFPFV